MSGKNNIKTDIICDAGLFSLFLRPFGSKRASSSALFTHCPKGPSPMQLVVVIAVRNAVSAATITFTATSMILFFMTVDFV